MITLSSHGLNRTLMEAARTMLIYAKAPLFLWAEAIATACYTQNRSLLRNDTIKHLMSFYMVNLLISRFFTCLVLYVTRLMIARTLGSYNLKITLAFSLATLQQRRLSEVTTDVPDELLKR